jgi:dihydroflavonol-4-reductase
MEDTPGNGFWQGRSVAVTGATGFVGLHLTRLLLASGARVTALVRDPAKALRLMGGVRCVVAPVEDAARVREACRGQEYLFHVAGAVDFGEDWGRFQHVNIDGTEHVLAAAREARVRRLVHTSSIVAVHASPRPVTVDETARWNLASARVPYVTTKRQAEELVLKAARDGLNAVVVNPASVLGPDDATGSEFGMLCKRFWRRRIPLYFSGGNNFVDVRDVARGHLLAAERGRRGERYILGGWNRSYRDFFAELARFSPRLLPRLRLPAFLAPALARLVALFDRRGSRSYLTPAQARLLGRWFWFDDTKARSELGYEPRPLCETLADTYAFWMGKRARAA